MKPALFLLIIILLGGCKSLVHKNNEIAKIEYARSGTWSDMGVSISIDSALDFKYWGNYKNEKQKYFVGKISQSFWDTLSTKVEEANFKSVAVTKDLGCADCEYYELIVHWNDKTKRILRVGFEQSDSIQRLFKWLDNSYSFVKLNRVKDAVNFETTAHSLKPSIRQIKFPPPAK